MDEKQYTISGKDLYNAFAKGAEKVIEKKRLLDDINVFPVADGDTGKNMAKTLRSIAEKTRPEKSVSRVSRDMAHAALVNSRGNSGIIFAQFINGISKATEKRDHLKLTEFANAMRVGANHAYKATSQPVEGTILTVMKEWARSLQERASEKRDLFESLDHSLEAAKKSLRETKSKLKELREANVVDAGAKGFVLFLEGILAFFKDGQRATFDKIGELEDEATVHIDESQGVKKSLESSYPRPQGGALRPIHGFATAISTLFTNFRIHPRPQDGGFCVTLLNLPGTRRRFWSALKISNTWYGEDE